MAGTDQPLLDVSVVLPVYNEAGHLTGEIERLRDAFDASPYSYEIVVVDDGSDDGSDTEAALVDGIRVLRARENRGYGAAIRQGIHAARGAVIAITDADGTYPNDRLPEMVKELDGFDMVVGARTSDHGTWRALRRPMKWLIRLLAELTAGRRIPDLNSGFRVFRADVARQFANQLPARFSCSTTLTMSFLANGYSVHHVPVEYAERAGTSKFRIGRDTAAYVSQVARLALGYHPLRVFLPLAFALGVLATAKLARDMTIGGSWVDGNTLLIYLSAFQLFAIGLLADLTVRRTRPQDAVAPAL